MYDVIRLTTAAGSRMPTAAHLILLAILVIGAAMWLGGMVAVTMLAVISKRALDPGSRAALFRRFARSYFPVFGGALIVGAAAGFILLVARGWDPIAWAITILTVVILIALVVGVAQARAMTRLRTRAAELGDNVPADLRRQIARQGRSAAMLRGSLGVLSAAVFVLAICTGA